MRGLSIFALRIEHLLRRLVVLGLDSTAHSRRKHDRLIRIGQREVVRATFINNDLGRGVADAD